MLRLNIFGVKIYARGAIIDIVRKGKPAIVFCWKHFKFWQENDKFESLGGKACDKCVKDFLDNRLRLL